MKFASCIDMVNLDLSIKGHIIYAPIPNVPKEINPSIIETLKNLHFQKILNSSTIYVIDLNGYIGESVKKEIEFATINNINIIYHSKNFL